MNNGRATQGSDVKSDHAPLQLPLLKIRAVNNVRKPHGVHKLRRSTAETTPHIYALRGLKLRKKLFLFLHGRLKWANLVRPPRPYK